MGGAFAGLSDDALAMYSNPAGMVNTRWTYDFSSAENLVINKELDITGDDRKDGLPYSTKSSALALKIGFLSLATGASSPYVVDFDFGGGTSNYKMKIESLDIAVALELFDGISIGAAQHNEKAVLSFTDSYMVASGSSEAELSTLSYGIAYRYNKSFGFGYSYFPERVFAVDTTISSAVPWFYDVVIASKSTMGVFWRMRSNLIWVLDVDTVEVPADTYFVGAINAANGLMVNKSYSIIHGGFEYYVLQSGSMDFIWRGGGYKEPARLVGNEDRLHFTMGVEFRFQAITVSAAYDQAADFSVTSQALNINFSKLY